MTTPTTILSGYSDMEKGAYLGAIASISTADRSASEEELEYINARLVYLQAIMDYKNAYCDYELLIGIEN